MAFADSAEGLANQSVSLKTIGGRMVSLHSWSLKCGQLYLVCFVAAVTPVLTACDGPTSPGASVTKSSAAENEQATIVYWEKFNQAMAAGDGMEALVSLENVTGVRPDAVVVVLRETANVERARCRAASELPVLGVASGVTDFAVRTMELRNERAEIATGFADLVERAAWITSGEAIGLGFVLSLMSRANEDEPLWSAIKDQASSTANAAKELKPAIDALTQRASVLATRRSALLTEEIQLRSALAQRFAKEFGPSSAFGAKKAQPSDSVLSEEQLRQTLLGTRVDSLRWTFESPKEYMAFTVHGSAPRDAYLRDYDVTTRVKGHLSGAQHEFKLRLTYLGLGDRHYLVEVTPRQ